MNKQNSNPDLSNLQNVLTSKTLYEKHTKQEKQHHSKEFIRILREAYERHVKSFRQSLSPLQSISTSFDITSYFIPKKLHTPKITNVQINRQPVQNQSRSLKRAMQRFSHKPFRPLPNIEKPRILREGSQEEDLVHINRISESKIRKICIPKKQLIARVATQADRLENSEKILSRTIKTKLSNWKNTEGNDFKGWENESNHSDIENMLWPN